MKTREEMIEAVVNSVEDWDLNTLIEYAMNSVEEDIKNLDDGDLEQVYFDSCVGD